jgi:predicted Abi (CAAX) family protease
MYNNKLVVIGLVILMTVFFIMFKPQNNTLAQNTGGATKSPEWLQIVGLAGVTAAISSAAISSVVNYIITSKKIIS